MSETVSHTLRVRLDLAYDGTGFHGWAAQPGLRAVQGVLEEALATVLRTPVHLTVAGRTDAGVHALGQVAHVDVDDEVWARLPGRSGRTPGEALVDRIAGVLARGSAGPKGTSDVVVMAATPVPTDFDARFSTVARTYSYRIATGASNPLRRFDTLWLPGALDVAAMREAARPLLGVHDFLSFCKPREGATTIRELQRLDVEERDSAIVVHARADAFCHSMVRTLVGSLIRVGQGGRPAAWPAERLAERSRNGEVIVAPPHPLTLESVSYPEPSEYGRRAEESRQRRCLDC